jgi:hypothetical protein
MTAEQMLELLRKKMEEIHDITQDTMLPSWQALQNIAATASSALSSTPPREIIEKLAAMTDAEFSQFMARHFEQLCKRPVTRPHRTKGE